ncbi:MAG TPA: helix-turn-helix domain-containing protein [Pedobacter sp.]|uniref:helix-turn-helix domain-containing protein n=1 Tax=Pedobacter sp. TaxID=1411316 RepID=UPI002CDF4EF9|nr:helix-turn-helix domain-containing protein [Pedobacter sp.]HMI01272.1 helix-turn-helix domain-containing protein [Pedobacter sp.]
MDWKEETKLKFGGHLLTLLKAYGEKHGDKKPSLRGLAARAGLEYSHVQRISKGQVDIALTTIVSLAQGLDLHPRELMEF